MLLVLAAAMMVPFTKDRTIISQDAKRTDDSSEINQEAERAIERGLDWLAKNQSRDGSYGGRSYGVPVAITSMVGMAFLAGGHHLGRSRYSENLKGCIQYLLKCCGRAGYINEGSNRGEGGSGMHGHGFALMFLASAYGLRDDRMVAFDQEKFNEKLKKAIQLGVKLTESAQAQNGGWNYEPVPSYDEGSVTVTQVQALRAARNAGFTVNKTTIDKAVQYINKSTHDDGKTQYSLSSGGRTSFALTAAGMSVMNYLGLYDNPKIKKGLDYIIESCLPGKGENQTGGSSWGGWFFYANLYATMAMYQAGGDYWKKWYPEIRNLLVKTQASDGSWKNAEGASYGAAFSTSMALIILQAPMRALPVLQSKDE